MSRASTSFSLVITVQNFLTPLAVPFGTPPHGFGSRAIAVIPVGTTVATFGGTALTHSSFVFLEIAQVATRTRAS